jgi:hypothetical protein
MFEARHLTHGKATKIYESVHTILTDKETKLTM